MKFLKFLPLIALSAFFFSACTLLPQRAPETELYTETPSEESLPTPLPEQNPDQEAVQSADSDEQLLDVLLNLDDPNFDSDLNTLETNLK